MKKSKVIVQKKHQDFIGIFVVEVNQTVIFLLGGLPKHNFRFHIHLLKSLEHTEADLLLRLHKLLHRLDVLENKINQVFDWKYLERTSTGHTKNAHISTSKNKTQKRVKTPAMAA